MPRPRIDARARAHALTVPNAHLACLDRPLRNARVWTGVRHRNVAGLLTRLPYLRVVARVVLPLPVFLAGGRYAAASAQSVGSSQVRANEIAPGFYLVSNSDANLVVYVGEDASLVAGVHSPALVDHVRELLQSIRAPAVRYTVMLDHDSAPVYGDGGWGRRGAVTLAHEMLYVRMRDLARAHAKGETALSPRNDLPALGFSHVVQVFMKNENAHLVHERSGASYADVIVHFEEAGLLLLGNIFTSDGYPAIDLGWGGGISGVIKWVEWFTDSFSSRPDKIEPVVPGRGPVATMEDLREYRTMLVAVRDRIQALRDTGRTLEEVIAASPTAPFDARWGHGPVKPVDFVKMVYESLK